MVAVMIPVLHFVDNLASSFTDKISNLTQCFPRPLSLQHYRPQPLLSSNTQEERFLDLTISFYSLELKISFGAFFFHFPLL